MKNKNTVALNIIELILIIAMFFTIISCTNSNNNMKSYTSIEELRQDFLKDNLDLVYLKTFSNEGKYYDVYNTKNEENLLRITSIYKDNKKYKITKISNYFLVENPVAYTIPEDNYSIECSFDKEIACFEKSIGY